MPFLKRKSKIFQYLLSFKPETCQSWHGEDNFFRAWRTRGLVRITGFLLACTLKGQLRSGRSPAGHWLLVGSHLWPGADGWEMGVLCTIEGQGCGLARFYGFRITIMYEFWRLVIIYPCSTTVMPLWCNPVLYMMMQCRVYHCIFQNWQH